MHTGKFVVKAKQTKFHKKEFEKKEADREHEKIKHHDKALLRSKKQEAKEDFDGFEVDEGYQEMLYVLEMIYFALIVIGALLVVALTIWGPKGD